MKEIGVNITQIEVTRMKNIKDASGLTKLAINRTVIVIINCY